ncbi:MAG: ABC transporter permease subunit, partial [Acidobacteria bacterium]|nr:ABC transporter permease subunit [Acidobacteriota bacterium]
AYDDDTPSFEKAEPPEAPSAALVAEWDAFLDAADLPTTAYAIGYINAGVSKSVPRCEREFKNLMIDRYAGDIEAANRGLGLELANWHGFLVLADDNLSRRNRASDLGLFTALAEFKATQPRSNRYYFTAEGFYKALFLKTQYTRNIDEYNRTHGTRYASYAEVHLARRLPEGTAKERRDWEDFVRGTLNLVWVRADPAARPLYQAFLRARYGDVAVFNRNYGTRFASFDAVPLVEVSPGSGIGLTDWEAFVSGSKDPDTGVLHMLPADMIHIDSVDFRFRDFLERKYGTIEAVNAALGTRAAAFIDVFPPQRDTHYLGFLPMGGDLRWEFSTRNYKAVLSYLLFHGRGIINTVIYCGGAVLLALIVNPLAAYAMSRYQMPTSYKILLLLMLTMAFPPMVTQIPVFIMLRELGLLNTFAALLLPGLANGYAIFLLKGFFDSLPRELYESASIDGASEWTMFWNITMSLSKPILAVIALHAFTLAYSNFMFALLICQDESMWTLMVWLYQLQQQEKGPGIVYASLIIAAVPTFLVFALAQKVIMRGIVVPVEK